MATIGIKIDASALVKTKSRIEKALDKEKLFRPVCIGLVEKMTKRIHIDGMRADGSEIGTYSEEYAKRRETKFKRSDNTKIVLALTSQLENGWAAVGTQKGYGVGFTDKRNYDLALILESKYKNTFKLSQQEKEYSIDYIKDLVRELI